MRYSTKCLFDVKRTDNQIFSHTKLGICRQERSKNNIEQRPL